MNNEVKKLERELRLVIIEEIVTILIPLVILGIVLFSNDSSFYGIVSTGVLTVVVIISTIANVYVYGELTSLLHHTLMKKKYLNYLS